MAPIESPVAVNHLFIGRRVAISNNKRNRHVALAPSIAPIYPNGAVPSLQIHSSNKGNLVKSQSQSLDSRHDSVTSASEVSSPGICHSNSSSPLESQSTASSPPARSGRVRTVSGTSLYSDMETASLHVPDETDISSLATGTDCESIASDHTDIASIDGDINTVESIPVTNTQSDLIICKDQTKCTNLSTEKTDILSDSDTVNELDGSDNESSDFVENKEVLEPDEDNQSSAITASCSEMQNSAELDRTNNHVIENTDTKLVFHNNNNNCAKSSSLSENDRDSKINSKILTNLSDELPSLSVDVDSEKSDMANTKQYLEMDGEMPTLLELSKNAPEDEFTEKLRRQNTGANNIMEPVKVANQSEDNAEYITKLTYKGHKKGQPSSADKITKEYYESKSQSVNLQDEEHSDTSVSKNAKAFNPFPNRHFNRNRTQNGIRLGLYTADTSQVMDGLTKKHLAGGKPISRAQINACLHRQYMAEVKQQSKGFNNH